ncbi:hypothetical protein DM860_014142 [Cuscuta australis]|uniref:Uncharacterized protein n=1 Tax=Cuscuta australis TaxID=267555 RepID=A0A328DDZ6_9ASTE|nr:hypothetical protein DM860_014142 [Cuscuta australis]
MITYTKLGRPLNAEDVLPPREISQASHKLPSLLLQINVEMSLSGATFASFNCEFSFIKQFGLHGSSHHTDLDPPSASRHKQCRNNLNSWDTKVGRVRLIFVIFFLVEDIIGQELPEKKRAKNLLVRVSK